MIKVKIVSQLEKRFNGLIVYLNVLEDEGERCSECGEDDSVVLKRSFEVAKITRGAVVLRLDTHYSREVWRFVRDKMRHDRILCLDCFEEIVDDELGGFEPAD